MTSICRQAQTKQAHNAYLPSRPPLHKGADVQSDTARRWQINILPYIALLALS